MKQDDLLYQLAEIRGRLEATFTVIDRLIEAVEAGRPKVRSDGPAEPLSTGQIEQRWGIDPTARDTGEAPDWFRPPMDRCPHPMIEVESGVAWCALCNQQVDRPQTTSPDTTRLG